MENIAPALTTFDLNEKEGVYMRSIGKLICIFGGAAAIVYPPYVLLGSTRWGFIFQDVVGLLGATVKVYDLIDTRTLLLELALIEGVGLALILGFPVRKKKGK